MVEGDLGNGTIGIDFTLQVRLCNILQGILIGLFLQKIGLGRNL